MAAFNIDAAPEALFPSILALAQNIDSDAGGYPSFTEQAIDCLGETLANAILWTIVSPTEFSTLLKRDPIVVDIEFPTLSLLDLHISVRIRSLGIDDVVYQNGRFSDKYQAFSTQKPTGEGKRFSIRRTEGWPVQNHDSEEDDIQLSVFGCQSAV